MFTGGEGRFVFGVLGPDGTPLPPLAGTVPGGFTVIFEYELIATGMNEVRDWAFRWRDLGKHPVGSPAYNDALERITRIFTDHGRGGRKPNGNAINQIRTNEVALGIPWELREFVINPRTHLLQQNTVALTPDTMELNGTEAFADFINDNEDVILSGGNITSESFGASSFSGPFLFDDFEDIHTRTFTAKVFFDPFFDIPWSAAGILNNEARHVFALNTCNGCHRDETANNFLHIGFPEDHRLPEKKI